eukprot:gene5483-6037_t
MLRLSLRNRFLTIKNTTSYHMQKWFSTSPPPDIVPPNLPNRNAIPFLVFLTGTFAGTVGSLVGMGGAFVALPFLSGYFGLRPHLAHGTSMAAVLATSIGGSLAYLQREPDFLDKLRNVDDLHNLPTMIGKVNVLMAACVALSSSLTVFAGARIAQAMSGTLLKKSLGIFMIAVAPTIPLRDHLKAISTDTKMENMENQSTAIVTTTQQSIDLENIDSVLPQVIKPLTIGACSGVLAGIFGVGGGAITVPALTLFTDLDYQVALGTSLAAMLPTAIFGSLAHIRHGTMRAAYAFPLGAGCLLGSYVGGTYGKHLGDKKLQYGFAAVMAILGGRTLLALRRLR